MPHFGLMDEDALGPVEGPLMRARLHIRCGRRRLREGKISAGIVTLYDALTSGMEYYAADEQRRKRLQVREGENLHDEKTLFRVLRRSDVLDDSLDFSRFYDLVKIAVEEEMPEYDWKGILEQLENIFTQLGIMPFNEDMLPPEKPDTF